MGHVARLNGDGDLGIDPYLRDFIGKDVEVLKLTKAGLAYCRPLFTETRISVPPRNLYIFNFSASA